MKTYTDIERLVKQKAYKKRYREANRELLRAKGKEYYQKNKDIITERMAKYKATHMDEFRKYQMEYRRNRRETDSEYKARLDEIAYRSHKKRYIHRPRKQRLNCDEIKNRRKARYEKNKQNSIWRLCRNIKRVVSYALKSNKQGRRTFEILGYTAIELKCHLESQFTEGMSWSNYGKWHIDHIIPISFFEFTSPDDVEFKMCWRLENLQPLWAKDNMAKNNKLKIAG